MNTSFKLHVSQLDRLDELVRSGFYVSRSEIIRESFIETVETIMLGNEDRLKDNWADRPKNDHLITPSQSRKAMVPSFMQSKKQERNKRIVCVSVPEHLLSLIDDLITMGLFESRSHFARTSVEKSLTQAKERGEFFIDKGTKGEEKLDPDSNIKTEPDAY